MNQAENEKTLEKSSLNEKRKYTRKLKFFRGKSVLNGRSIDICVIATSIDQCIDLCSSSGLTDTTKKRIKESWSIFSGNQSILELESLPPLIEPGVWHLPQSHPEENHSQNKENIIPNEKPLSRSEANPLGYGISIANWPFPVVYLDKNL